MTLLFFLLSFQNDRDESMSNCRSDFNAFSFLVFSLSHHLTVKRLYWSECNAIITCRLYLRRTACMRANHHVSKTSRLHEPMKIKCSRHRLWRINLHSKVFVVIIIVDINKIEKSWSNEQMSLLVLWRRRRKKRSKTSSIPNWPWRKTVLILFNIIEISAETNR